MFAIIKEIEAQRNYKFPYASNRTNCVELIMANQTITKFCPTCQQSKFFNEFYKNKSRADGLSSLCRNCRNTRYKNPNAKSQYRKDKLKGFESEVIKSYQDGMSLKKVANRFDVTFIAVFNLLKKHNIPRRSVSEGTKLSCTPERNKSHSKKLKGKKTGAENHSWKGGITPENVKIRQSAEYKEWRKAVFIRDNFTCVFCKKQRKYKEIEIQADHIKPFSQYPELRFDIGNGRTLCVDCHRKTETYGGNSAFKKF